MIEIPPLPPAFGLLCGLRLTPEGVTEFFGPLYGTTAGDKCDLYTADQMREYAALAIKLVNERYRFKLLLELVNNIPI